jgi:hypothetical protein
VKSTQRCASKLAIFVAVMLMILPMHLQAQDRIIAVDSSASIELPYSFQPLLLNPKAVLQFGDTATQVFVMVFPEGKADLVGWNLTRHSTITLAQLLTSIDLPEVVGPRKVTINGQSAFQYEVRGAMQGTRISYLHTTVETPSAFVQVVAWTPESKWKDNAPFMQKLSASVDLPQSISVSTDIFQLVPGTWAWDNKPNACQGMTQRFEIASDRKTMRIYHSEPIEGFDGEKTSVTDYVIEGSEPGVLHTFIPAETRKTDAGEPVKWDLVAVGRNRIAWHRADWPEAGLTDMLRRCDTL